MSDAKITNAGAVALHATGKSLNEIGRAVGFSRGTVSHWRRGNARPRNETREKLRVAFGIAVDAWDQSLEAGEEPSAEASAPTVQAAPNVVPPYPKMPDGGTTLDHARHELLCIRHDMEHRNVTITARGKLRAEHSRTLILVAKLEQQAESSEDRFVREHPAWITLRTKILAALGPFPDAAKAVLEAIQ